MMHLSLRDAPVHLKKSTCENLEFILKDIYDFATLFNQGLVAVKD